MCESLKNRIEKDRYAHSLQALPLHPVAPIYLEPFPYSYTSEVSFQYVDARERRVTPADVH